PVRHLAAAEYLYRPGQLLFGYYLAILASRKGRYVSVQPHRQWKAVLQAKQGVTRIQRVSWGLARSELESVVREPLSELVQPRRRRVAHAATHFVLSRERGYGFSGSYREAEEKQRQRGACQDAHTILHELGYALLQTRASLRLPHQEFPYSVPNSPDRGSLPARAQEQIHAWNPMPYYNPFYTPRVSHASVGRSSCMDINCLQQAQEATSAPHARKMPVPATSMITLL